MLVILPKYTPSFIQDLIACKPCLHEFPLQLCPGKTAEWFSWQPRWIIIPLYSRFSKYVLQRPATPVLSGNLLKMHNLKPHPRPTASEFAFLQDAQLILVQVLDWEVWIYTSTYSLVPTEISHSLAAGGTSSGAFKKDSTVTLISFRSSPCPLWSGSPAWKASPSRTGTVRSVSASPPLGRGNTPALSTALLSLVPPMRQ